MNKVEAFKNELRNYRYYKAEYERLCKIYEQESNLVSDENIKDRYKLLREFYKGLDAIEKEHEGLWTMLVDVSAIRYDAEPVAPNEANSEQRKLELVEKYNDSLTKFKVNLMYAEENLIEEMNRMSKNINHIEKVLSSLSKQIANVCIEIYCNGRKYEDISNGNNVYWSPSGVYWNVNKELEKVLNGMD